ncbi:MAG: beta-ketoacyl-ACP synthase III, partial [Brevundimonas sp.]
ADSWNAENAEAIAAGELELKTPSSEGFIEKASGIKSRFVMDKSGILDPSRMLPNLPARSNDELSIMAEMAVKAAQEAIKAWGKPVSEIDAVICAASNMQRGYPALAIEVQQALGIEGFAFDMNVACSSATFGIKTAADFVASGSAKAVLMVNPEICSAHLNFKDRDSHFIFGDVATAVIIEAEDQAGPGGWDIVGTKLKTSFSNNIRNNFGFLNRAALPTGESEPFGSDGVTDKMFVQQGRKVFKEVVPMVSDMILDHAAELNLDPHGLKRMWLHQANINMNQLIGKKVLGREPDAEENVIILDDYANTSSAGSIIAFHLKNDGFVPGDVGLICSFGAGYSAGTVFVQKRP